MQIVDVGNVLYWRNGNELKTCVSTRRGGRGEKESVCLCLSAKGVQIGGTEVKSRAAILILWKERSYDDRSWCLSISMHIALPSKFQSPSSVLINCSNMLLISRLAHARLPRYTSIADD